MVFIRKGVEINIIVIEVGISTIKHEHVNVSNSVVFLIEYKLALSVYLVLNLTIRIFQGDFSSLL